ncbi:MAG: serine/threonine protein kinase [Chloroflexi bacterium]|mgnify:CR=1 FL=1|jgi:serine/threonine protein kinase|nr:serine/threonine protein kinase [Chloroflexota bacterium]
MATLAGQMLGKYQVIERLGRGGMAEVYKAHHPQLERYAAIKVLHHFLAEGKDFTARFQREAKAIATLRHPNIVQVYDFESQDDLYYMIMEFVDGGTLKDRLLQSAAPLPYAEIVHIIQETASALGYAHRQGMLHRDIKPANVLLGKDGRVVLTDFGIARILSDTQFTATGTLVGTPSYMSPEQGMGLHVSAASDIYSLGVILYEMVTGKVPFDSDTPLAVIHKHINEPLPRPRSLRPDIPPALEAVIEKALEKDPAQRYASADEFKNALDEAFDVIPVPQQDARRAPSAAEARSRERLPEVYDKATVAMQAQDDPISKQTIASRPTVAMEPAEADMAEKATVAMEVEAPMPQKSQRVSERQSGQTSQPAARANRIKIIFGFIGAAILALLLIWGIPKLSGGGSATECVSIEECQILAEELLRNGDATAAVETLDVALRYADAEAHPHHAHLWCLRGEALASLERFDEAIWSFEDCQGWTEGDPGLEDLRVFAQEQLDMLHSR